MATTLDLSALPPHARQEVLDFYQFLLARTRSAKKSTPNRPQKRRFADLCGRLTWKGDAGRPAEPAR